MRKRPDRGLSFVDCPLVMRQRSCTYDLLTASQNPEVTAQAQAPPSGPTLPLTPAELALSVRHIITLGQELRSRAGSPGR